MAKIRHRTMRLKRDILIPAGTIFFTAPTMTKRYGNEHFHHIIGLTDDTSGSLEYCVDEGDPEIMEWFEEVVI